MAEAILKEKLRRMQGSDVKVGSAGIYHFTTLPRDPMVVQIPYRNGLSFTSSRPSDGYQRDDG